MFIQKSSDRTPAFRSALVPDRLSRYPTNVATWASIEPYCQLALMTSLPCRHRWSIGLRCGLRFGNHSNSNRSASANLTDAAAVWLVSSSSSIARSQLAYRSRANCRSARKSSPRCRFRGSSSRWPVARLIVPNRTRLALAPLIGTGAGLPRSAHPARNGGNSRMSVSSSASTTTRLERWRNAAIWRRIWRFFLALRVGRQHVPVALPDVPQVLQLAADGVVRHPHLHAVQQVLLQQRHRPVGSLVAQVVRPQPQRGSQRRRQFHSP